jgi:HK97 gp10 family phage protein
MPADVSQLLALAGRTQAAVGKVTGIATREVAKVTKETTEQAKANAPHLTGALADSITGTASGLTGTVETSIRYAQFVEFGTGHGPPQPYLIPAAENAEESLSSGLEAALLGAVNL